MSAEVPFVDLAWQHRQVAAEVGRGFAEVIASSSFVLGEQVSAFERELADHWQLPHCVAVANGTDALEIALRATGVGPGDEVILPANTFVATAEAVYRAGAAVVLVDSDPVHHLIDPEQAADRIGPRTRALLPVHLFGQMAPMEDLVTLADPEAVVVIEDAAQAQGALRHGKPPGAFGAAAATSFYPGKNLGAYGDGGAVLTGSEELARRVRVTGNHGQVAKYDHAELGFNSRLDSLQAVVLRAKLGRLADWNEHRRQAASHYDELLAGLTQVRPPSTAPGNEHVWHLYVVRVPRRDHVLRALGDAGVRAGVHYPAPIHLQGAFSDLGKGRGSFPVAEQAADEILSLPIFPGITADQQARVVEVLADALARP